MRNIISTTTIVEPGKPQIISTVEFMPYAKNGQGSYAQRVNNGEVSFARNYTNQPTTRDVLTFIRRFITKTEAN